MFKCNSYEIQSEYNNYNLLFRRNIYTKYLMNYKTSEKFQTKLSATKITKYQFINQTN